LQFEFAFKTRTQLGYSNGLCSKGTINVNTCPQKQEEEMPTFHIDITNPSGSPATIMATNETWVCHSEPESQQQSIKWHHTTYPGKKFRSVLLAGKIMATVFLDEKGVLGILRIYCLERQQ
jgi:hypothetical protein